MLDAFASFLTEPFSTTISVGACMIPYFFTSSMFSSASITSYGICAFYREFDAIQQFGHVFVVNRSVFVMFSSTHAFSASSAAATVLGRI